MRSLLAIIGLLSVLATVAVTAAAPGPPPPPPFNPRTTLHFRHLTTDDGLPSNSIRALLQDRRGFFWFGTAEGLARYDGYQVRTFRHSATDPQSLGSDRITSLEEDQDGMLWIGTDDAGIDHFDPATGLATHIQPDRTQPNQPLARCKSRRWISIRLEICGWLPQGAADRRQRSSAATGPLERSAPTRSSAAIARRQACPRACSWTRRPGPCGF